MKHLYFLTVSICCITMGIAQENSNLKKEITTIENSLIKAILVKGAPIKTFNIQERMEYYKVPGISIAVVENGSIKWAKGYGFANTKSGTKVDQNTLFQAGSISKPIAALAVLKLWENNRLNLQTDVNVYLKNWQITNNKFTKTEKVTLEKLLTHTAGVTVHGFPGYQQTDEFPEIIDVLNGNGNTPKIVVDTLPGSIWRYSGGGYTVMEKVVEDLSSMAFEVYMAKQLLKPMGMNNSTYQQPISEHWQHNISAAYDGEGQLIAGLWHNYPEQAAAGLWTTASDLALYCIEIQNIAQGKEGGILSKSTVSQMLSKHQNNWGLGPKLTGEGSDLLFGHGGKNAGFTNDMQAFVHKGNAVIIMTNADNGGKLITEIQNAISKYYNWPISEPTLIEVINLSETQLTPFKGSYEMKEEGLTLEVLLEKNQLSLKNTPIGNLNLLPLSSTKFIDIDSGTLIEFLVDKEVSGFIANNTFKFIKQDD